jgi:hypothetical protein
VTDVCALHSMLNVPDLASYKSRPALKPTNSFSESMEKCFSAAVLYAMVQILSLHKVHDRAVADQLGVSNQPLVQVHLAVQRRGCGFCLL